MRSSESSARKQRGLRTLLSLCGTASCILRLPPGRAANRLARQARHGQRPAAGCRTLPLNQKFRRRLNCMILWLSGIVD